MNLKNLRALLTLHPEALPRFILPEEGQIPQHFHITEVGHVTKRFIDCGGKLHDRRDICLLQTWVNDDDSAHRLSAETFAKILRLGDQVLPNDEMEVEVEYQNGLITQSPITSAEFSDGYINLQLGAKQTDCLAKERCGTDSTKAEAASSCCC